MEKGLVAPTSNSARSATLAGLYHVKDIARCVYNQQPTGNDTHDEN